LLNTGQARRGLAHGTQWAWPAPMDCIALRAHTGFDTQLAASYQLRCTCGNCVAS
jgi:hypothetical protein